MSRSFLLMFAMALAACQADPDQTIEEPSETPEAIGPDVPGDRIQPARSDDIAPDDGVKRCDRDGEFGVSVAAAGLADVDGTRVWLSAVEPVNGGDDVVVVLLGGKVEGGAFKLACERGLRTNYVYPSLAVVLDRDGSGACSAGDDVFRMQLYGWNQDEVYGLVGDQVETPYPMEGAWLPVTEVPPPWGEDLCAYHFPAL